VSENAASHRQQNLYWNQMVELTVAAEYMRRYRDDAGKRVAALGTLKAIASSGGIAAWVIWKEHAFVWGAIIAASQLADALKEVFPHQDPQGGKRTHHQPGQHVYRRPAGMGKHFLWKVLR
jgi:hypothetical protein